LKKLSSFVWTYKWLICLPKCHVSFKVCTQPWTVLFVRHISILINCNRISEGFLYVWSTYRSANIGRMMKTEGNNILLMTKWSIPLTDDGTTSFPL
jgi:hypothetical protein